MKCTASYRSQLGANGLQTVGVMVLGGSTLTYTAPAGLEGHEQEMRQIILTALAAGHDPADLFAYLLGTANGKTVDWSIPFTMEGEPEDAARQLSKGIGA